MTPESKTTLEDISVEMQLGWYRQMFLIRAFEREVYQLNTSGLVRRTAHLVNEGWCTCGYAAEIMSTVIEDWPSRIPRMAGTHTCTG
jgi:TPP-dependent pyruvate/acetoin dehydrogenase alpha subunit